MTSLDLLVNVDSCSFQMLALQGPARAETAFCPGSSFGPDSEMAKAIGEILW